METTLIYDTEIFNEPCRRMGVDRRGNWVWPGGNISLGVIYSLQDYLSKRGLKPVYGRHREYITLVWKTPDEYSLCVERDVWLGPFVVYPTGRAYGS